MQMFANGGDVKPFHHLVELTILNVQNVCELIGCLPGFDRLRADDQITLRKVRVFNATTV